MGVKAVGAHIRALRKHSGLTMLEVANAAGVHPNYVWRIETGDIKAPSLENIAGIVDALKGSLDMVGNLLRNKTATPQDGKAMAQQWLEEARAEARMEARSMTDDELAEAIAALERIRDAPDLLTRVTAFIERLIDDPAAPARPDTQRDELPP